MTCPSLEELMEFLRGFVPPATKTAIEQHLSSGCPSCVKNRQWLHEILDAARRDDSFEFSEETIRWSVAQFKAISSMMPSRGQLLAKLIFDSLRPTQAVDVRSIASPISGRQMLYQSADYEVDLRLEPDEDARTVLVIGQIDATTRRNADLSRMNVQLVSIRAEEQPETKQTETDSRGMFRFRSVRDGDYDLVINLPEGDLLIHAIACRTE